jgi:hypothetical protein
MLIELKSLFATPLIKFKFTKHHLYNFPEVEKKERIPPGWLKSLNSSFGDESGDSFLSSSKRKNLINDITEDLITVFESLNIEPNIEIKQLWYNIYHDNQGQETHDHLSSCIERLPIFSGIYYNKNPSPTSFERMDNYHKLTNIPEIKNSKLEDYYNDVEIPNVSPGDIILFPPWIPHSVDTKNNKKMRLTFAFNVEYNI